MRDQHVDPEEAVKIHMDVQSMKSFGIHWGTFAMTDEVTYMIYSRSIRSF